MPVVNIEIVKAWRHLGETGRIHYTVRRANGLQRHLVADEEGPTHGLYAVLEAHLATQGYTGPRERVGTTNFDFEVTRP